MCPNCPGAGSELDNLGVSGSGQIPLLTCRLVYLLAWIKLPLREEMWLSSLHNHVPAVLVRGHESDGRKPDWLGVVRCCNSGDVFAAGLALVPALPLPPIRAPAQEKISSHSLLLSSGMWPRTSQLCSCAPHEPVAWRVLCGAAGRPIGPATSVYSILQA